MWYCNNNIDYYLLFTIYLLLKLFFFLHVIHIHKFVNIKKDQSFFLSLKSCEIILKKERNLYKCIDILSTNQTGDAINV